MRIGVLGNEGSWYVADINRAALRRGHEVTRLEFSRISAMCGSGRTVMDVEQQPLDTFDVIIVRTMPPGSLEQVVFRMDVLGRLEAQGTLVVNPPRSMECAVDKFLTTARLESAGLPVPRTVTCQDADSAMLAFESLGGDVVVKPLFGAEGRGICRVSDPDLAFRTFRTLERTDAVLYLQEFIPHAGYDIRVLVLDGQILGGMRRSNSLDFRTNVARSASTEPHEPTMTERRMALAAADVTGTDVAGIDLLYNGDGRCYVIEVNAVPGWQAFARTTGIDVADRLLESLEHRTDKRRGSSQ